MSDPAPTPLTPEPLPEACRDAARHALDALEQGAWLTTVESIERALIAFFDPEIAFPSHEHAFFHSLAALYVLVMCDGDVFYGDRAANSIFGFHRLPPEVRDDTAQRPPMGHLNVLAFTVDAPAEVAPIASASDAPDADSDAEAPEHTPSASSSPPDEGTPSASGAQDDDATNAPPAETAPSSTGSNTPTRPAEPRRFPEEMVWADYDEAQVWPRMERLLSALVGAAAGGSAAKHRTLRGFFMGVLFNMSAAWKAQPERTVRVLAMLLDLAKHLNKTARPRLFLDVEELCIRLGNARLGYEFSDRITDTFLAQDDVTSSLAMLRGRADCLRRLGRLGDACRFERFMLAVQVGNDLPDVEANATRRRVVGLLMERGLLRQAEAEAEAMLVRARRQGDDVWEADVRLLQARLMARRGLLGEARKITRRMASLTARYNDAALEARAQVLTAHVERRLGELRRAKRALDRAHHNTELAADDASFLAWEEAMLSVAAHDAKSSRGAKTLAQHTSALHALERDDVGFVRGALARAWHMLAQGEPNDAMHLLGRAWERLDPAAERPTESPHLRGLHHLCRAEALAATSAWEDALSWAARAAGAFSDAGADIDQGDALALQAELHLKAHKAEQEAGTPDDTRRALVHAYALFAGLKHKDGTKRVDALARQLKLDAKAIKQDARALVVAPVRTT